MKSADEIRKTDTYRLIEFILSAIVILIAIGVIGMSIYFSTTEKESTHTGCRAGVGDNCPVVDDRANNLAAPYEEAPYNP